MLAADGAGAYDAVAVEAGEAGRIFSFTLALASGGHTSVRAGEAVEFSRYILTSCI